MNPKPHYCLLLEDDPEDTEIFMEALNEVSSETACFATSNGREAIEVLETGDCIPDLIISDFSMPHMDGIEFLKRLRTMERFRHIPFILFTGDYSEYVIEKAQRFGANAVLSKARIGTLRDVIRQYLVDRPAGGFITFERDKPQGAEPRANRPPHFWV